LVVNQQAASVETARERLNLPGRGERIEHMTTISIEEAQAKLAELIHQLDPGGEVLITENDQPVARLVAAAGAGQRKLGTLRGTVKFMAADFDAPLHDFKEYMQ
jgi:antitoxin (DNA-binding transcriptional repressor) of toxin-antitoxin stability system